ncbi:hypothetical protein [Streptomyces sp. NPDC001388]|uniref:hypothetical protein n=1 Tax=Streptomyces sp. NPDC001388 TaxID=3364568 RepID=UPI0036C00779
MHALGRFGELAWFSLPTEINPKHGYHQVPYLGWRYTTPREGLAEYIEGAVRTLPTEVDWSLDTTRRNWLLVPTRILRDAQGLTNPAFGDVVHFINTQDQDFCLRALSDFRLIIQHLERLELPRN